MKPISALPDADALRDVLRSIDDAEAGMNIVDLGLVYGVEAGAEGVQVDLTMTSGACPMAEMIVGQVHDAIQSVVPPRTPVEVRLVWDPPWTPDKMTGIAKEHFGWPC